MTYRKYPPEPPDMTVVAFLIVMILLFVLLRAAEVV